MVVNLSHDEKYFLWKILFDYLVDLLRSIDKLDINDSSYDSQLDSIKEKYNFVFRIYFKLGD